MKTKQLCLNVFMMALTFHISSSFAAMPLPHLPNQDNPSTPLGPTLKGRYSGLLMPVIGYSLLGEAGFKQARIGGTVGWQFQLNQRFKFSAEYLWQQISYAFFTDDTQQWVNQGALGLSYEYLFLNYCFDPSFDFEAYYSRALSKSLSTQSGLFINESGNTLAYLDRRRLSGSSAGGIAPGVSFSPWFGAKGTFLVNYEKVFYNKTYGPATNPNGLGATFRFTQAISEYVFIGASAAFRKPFNNYATKLAWLAIPYYGGVWTLGFDAAYTAGKETLHNSWDVGLNFEYFLGPYPVPLPLNLNVDCQSHGCAAPPNNHLVEYTAKPSVYLPQVLAIEDERVRITPP